jgi:hypothetical protein
MNFEDFSNVVRFEGLTLETHDFYLATFSYSINNQSFLDYAYQRVPELQGIWFKTIGNVSYFVVAEGTVIPEDFADSLTKIEEPVQAEEPILGEQ